MALEGEDGVGVGRVVDFKEANLGVAAGGEELFVGGYFEAVDLAVGAAEGAGVYAGWCLPETDFVVI